MPYASLSGAGGLCLVLGRDPRRWLLNTGGPQTTLGWAPEDMSSDLVLCCVVCVTEEEATRGAWAFLFTL